MIDFSSVPAPKLSQFGGVRIHYPQIAVSQVKNLVIRCMKSESPSIWSPDRIPFESLIFCYLLQPRAIDLDYKISDMKGKLSRLSLWSANINDEKIKTIQKTLIKPKTRFLFPIPGSFPVIICGQSQDYQHQPQQSFKRRFNQGENKNSRGSRHKENRHIWISPGFVGPGHVRIFLP